MHFVTVIFQILTHSIGNILNSVGAAGKVFEYLDRTPQVSTDGKLKPDHLTGHVRFCGLNFAYPACPDKTVLQVKSELQVDEEGAGFSEILQPIENNFEMTSEKKNYSEYRNFFVQLTTDALHRHKTQCQLNSVFWIL